MSRPRNGYVLQSDVWCTSLVLATDHVVVTI